MGFWCQELPKKPYTKKHASHPKYNPIFLKSSEPRSSHVNWGYRLQTINQIDEATINIDFTTISVHPKKLAKTLLEYILGFTTKKGPKTLQRLAEAHPYKCIYVRKNCPLTSSNGQRPRIHLGYSLDPVTKEKSPVLEYIARIVCWACHGLPREYDPTQHHTMEVCHHTGRCRSTKSAMCINPFHLSWQSQAQNNRDRFRKK